MAIRKKSTAREIGTVTYSDGIRGAIVDIKNGCCELLAGVVEANDQATLSTLHDMAARLATELQHVQAAAADKIKQRFA